MSEYEIYLYADRIINLHKQSPSPFSWTSLWPIRDLLTEKFNTTTDGKIIREELLNKGLIILAYPNNSLVTSLTLEGSKFGGFLTQSDAEQDSKYPKVLRAYTYHQQQDFTNADFEEIILNPTHEQSFKLKHFNKEIRSFSIPKPPKTFDTPDFGIPSVVQHFHKTEYHVAESNAQFFQESTISDSQVKQENKIVDGKLKIIPWYLTWQFKYLVWPLIVALIVLAVELYIKSGNGAQK